MGPMVARMRIILFCLPVACSCGGSGLRISNSHDAGGGSEAIVATRPPDASATVGSSGGSIGTGGGPGGGGSAGGQLAATASTAPAICIPGASVACLCFSGQQGAKTCTSAGTFGLCMCTAPAADAGNANGGDGAAASPQDAPAATGGSDAGPATGGAAASDALGPRSGGGATNSGGVTSSAGTTGAGAASSAGHDRRTRGQFRGHGRRRRGQLRRHDRHHSAGRGFCSDRQHDPSKAEPHGDVVAERESLTTPPYPLPFRYLFTCACVSMFL